jgi:hypothetical protein
VPVPTTSLFESSGLKVVAAVKLIQELFLPVHTMEGWRLPSKTESTRMRRGSKQCELSLLRFCQLGIGLKYTACSILGRQCVQVTVWVVAWLIEPRHLQWSFRVVSDHPPSYWAEVYSPPNSPRICNSILGQLIGSATYTGKCRLVFRAVSCPAAIRSPPRVLSAPLNLSHLVRLTAHQHQNTDPQCLAVFCKW